MAICPNCGNQSGEGAIFCDQCGTRIPAPEAAAPDPVTTPASGSVICPACGAGNVPGEAFCDYCGSPLEAPVPTAEAVPELETVSTAAELEVESAPDAPAAKEGTPEAAAAEASASCPACGADVQPDEAFCGECGASLAKAPIPPEPVAEVTPEPVAEASPEPGVEEAPPEPVSEAEPEMAVEAAPAPVEPAVPPVPERPAALVCPACGSELEEGDMFCSACGFALQEAQAPAPVAEEAAAPTPPAAAAAPAGARLVVGDSGAEIPLSVGPEILIGREDPVSGIFPEVDLTPHGGEEGGVSRRHAKIFVEGGNYFVEDLDSTNFTFVNKQKLAPRTRQQVNDGDELRCGRVAMILKTQ